MNELRRVLSVWSVPGPKPRYHQKVKDALQENWPTLWGALVDLEKAYLLDGATIEHPTKRWVLVDNGD